MTKGQRTIATLLAVVAVLLGLNLLTDPPEAEAQGPPERRTAVVSGVAFTESNSNTYRVWRFWSDGAIDSTFVGIGGKGCNVFQEPCGPVEIIPPP